MTIGMSNFYLMTPLKNYECLRTNMKTMPEEIIKEHGLEELQHNGWVRVEIRKGVYVSPQAGMLANDLLKERLQLAGCYPTSTTPGLWRHQWRPIVFCLVVDDFGV